MISSSNNSLSAFLIKLEEELSLSADDLDVHKILKEKIFVEVPGKNSVQDTVNALNALVESRLNEPAKS